MTEVAAVQRPCPWHRQTLASLVARRAAGQLPHALLLGGPAGIGKGRLARSLAEALLCQAPEHGSACGRCHACRLLSAGSHPDMLLVAPEEAGKALRVDRIRELAGFCARTSGFGGMRVVLIAPAEAMNRNAQNALLKTLEEPGEGTLLLLVSHQPGQLFATVRSRCQKVTVPAPAATEALAWLTEQTGNGDRAAALLEASRGAPLGALAIEGSEWFPVRARLVGQLLAVAEGRTPASVAARDFRSVPPAEMLEALQRWGHLGLRLLATGTVPADRELSGPLERLARRAGPRRLLDFVDEAGRRRVALARGANPNHELMYEELLLGLAGVRAASS